MKWMPRAAPFRTPLAVPASVGTRLACRSSAKMVETSFVVRSRSRGWSLTRQQRDVLAPGFQDVPLSDVEITQGWWSTDLPSAALSLIALHE